MVKEIHGAIATMEGEVMTYEDEQREEHQCDLDIQAVDRVTEAVGYSEREKANMLKAVERLEQQNAKLVAALEVFFKVVVVDGKQYRPGYPLCAGCEELTVARGMECFYKPLTTECKYPDELQKAAKVKEE